MKNGNTSMHQRVDLMLVIFKITFSKAFNLFKESWNGYYNLKQNGKVTPKSKHTKRWLIIVNVKKFWIYFFRIYRGMYTGRFKSKRVQFLHIVHK